MYDTHNVGFITAACNYNREIDTEAVVYSGDYSITLKTSDIMSYKVVYASVSGKHFIPGSFVDNRLSLSLNSASTTVSEFDFKNTPIDSISLKAGIKVGDAFVYVPMGIFYPDDDGVSIDDEYINIEAGSIPKVLNAQFNSEDLVFPNTIARLMHQLSTLAGVTIISAQFANEDITLSQTFALKTTYREALMYFAEAVGAFVYMDRFGRVQFAKMFTEVQSIGCTLDDNYLFTVDNQGTTVKPFQYISIKANKDDLGATYEIPDVDTNCTYEIIDNPLTYGYPDEFLEGLVDCVNSREFYPSKISFQGRPDLDIGDTIEYTHKNVTYLLPICRHTFEYNGGFKSTLESIGSDLLKSSSLDASTKTSLKALKQNINSLLRDLSETQSRIVEIDGDLTRLSELTQTVEGLQTTVARIDGDSVTKSELSHTADSLRLSISKGLEEVNQSLKDNQDLLTSYFNFQSDGLVIGTNSSTLKLKLSNNRISFLKDSNEVAYFSEGQLYVTDAHFLRKLVLGNFEFVPRSNGNLSLQKRS